MSRAWVLDRRLERMVEGEEEKFKSKRLCQAMEMARQAGREDLETRRRNYCLAARFKGPSDVSTSQRLALFSANLTILQ